MLAARMGFAARAFCPRAVCQPGCGAWHRQLARRRSQARLLGWLVPASQEVDVRPEVDGIVRPPDRWRPAEVRCARPTGRPASNGSDCSSVGTKGVVGALSAAGLAAATHCGFVLACCKVAYGLSTCLAAGSPSLGFAGEGRADLCPAWRCPAVATAVEARAVSYAVSPNNEWNVIFLEEG